MNESHCKELSMVVPKLTASASSHANIFGQARPITKVIFYGFFAALMEFRGFICLVPSDTQQSVHFFQ